MRGQTVHFYFGIAAGLLTGSSAIYPENRMRQNWIFIPSFGGSSVESLPLRSTGQLTLRRKIRHVQARR